MKMLIAHLVTPNCPSCRGSEDVYETGGPATTLTYWTCYRCLGSWEMER